MNSFQKEVDFPHGVKGWARRLHPCAHRDALEPFSFHRFLAYKNGLFSGSEECRGRTGIKMQT